MAINDYLQGINRATAGEKTDVSNAAQDLSTLQAGAGSLPSKLKEALNLKLNNNKDIIEQQADTMQEYFSSGAKAREKYQDVWDPFKKAALVAQDRTMALRPYDVLSGVLENRMGSVNDIVQSGIQGWQGLVNAATTKVDLAKSNLATALQAYMSAVGSQQNEDQMSLEAAKAAESSRQFNLNYGLEQTKITNQDKQFYDDLNAKLKIASMSAGGKGGMTQQDKDKLTAATWTDVMASTGGDLSKIWNAIHSNETIWANAGVNVQAMWDQYTRMGGSSQSPVSSPDTGVSWLQSIFGGGTTQPSKLTPYGQSVIDAANAKKRGVLQPGDPGYANLSGLSGYNLIK